ncbi:hypothetical protein ACMFMG_002638 [Clarireedia jacksonii]
MAEIELIASIIAVVQISEGIASACKSYIDTFKDFPKDFRLIYIETGTLKVIFDGLRFLDVKDPVDSAILEKLRGTDGPVEGCKNAMKQLEALLPALYQPNSTRNFTKRQKIQARFDRLAWPLKAARAEKLLNEIMRHKSTINISLQEQFLKEIRSMKSQMDDIQNRLNSMEKRDLCSWYEHTNPWSYHNKANVLHEPNTGDWVFRTREWNSWVNGRTQSLWYHGTPGAGKTILASHVIKELIQKCEVKDERSTCLFYYCYSGHGQDESLPFLQWVVSQLLRQIDKIPLAAYKAHARNVKPNRSLLLEIFTALLESFDLVYVAVDAIDESQARHNLLDVLEVLGTDSRFKKLQLFVTSREY